LLHTTWHTLSENMKKVIFAASISWNVTGECRLVSSLTALAAHLRAFVPAAGNYEDSGWAPTEIDL